MRIFVTGLMSLHWGRLEYGNVGNYYITEPFFRQLHRVFPNAEIVTTLQMTSEFQVRENISSLPLDLYYVWEPEDVQKAFAEYGAASLYSKSGCLSLRTNFIDEVLKSDLIINLSGDMWGDYAEHVGHKRFLVDLLKFRTAQLLKKPTVLFAGSQGPFRDAATRDFAKVVYEGFTAVIAREPNSVINVEQYGFNTGNTEVFACPAFLFQPEKSESMEKIFRAERIAASEDSRPLVGLVVCGFNFAEQPYDKWPRADSEFASWIEVAEHIINTCGARLILLSHSNGFDIPPQPFKLKHGRDYPIAKRLGELIIDKGVAKMEDVLIPSEPYIPKQLKAIIGRLDMLVTGRVHASVAATSMCVPTVFIRYNKGMKSTKIDGFAKLLDMQNYVVSPDDVTEINACIDKCWGNREDIRQRLKKCVPNVQEAAIKSFDRLALLLNGETND